MTRCYTQSLPNDLISTTTHKVSINDWGEKCKDRKIDLRNCLQRNLHTIPVTVNGSIQKGNNKVKPTKLDTNSSDYMNVKLNVKEKGSKNSILVMGDSHERGFAGRLKNKLNNAFNVRGIVKLWIVISTLTSMANSNMDKLTVIMQQFFGVTPMMLATTILMMD